MTSAVLILPAAYRAAGNAFGVAQGWGEGNFSVPLSADANEPASHYGCLAQVTQGFLDLMADPPQEAVPLLAVMVSDFSDTLDPFVHWVTVMAANGLARAETIEGTPA